MGLLALLAALLLAFARVYVGVHYPADVVVGLFGGAVIAAVVVLGLLGPVTALARRLTDTPLRPLITTTPQTTRAGLIDGQVPDPVRRR